MNPEQVETGSLASPNAASQSATARPLTQCPLCEAALDPANPNECPKCDWVVGYRRRQSERLGTARDRAALMLSVIPGLGHIYKGHRLTGALLMLGALFAVMACSVAATATAGFGLLLLPLYWAGVMLQVYWLEDRAAKSIASQKPL
jgi:hypothetical protein